jgi:hypothetical protein
VRLLAQRAANTLFAARGAGRRRRGRRRGGRGSERTCTRAQPWPDLVQVIPDGARADEEASGDLGVGEAVSGEPRDLRLLGGEVRLGSWWDWRCLIRRSDADSIAYPSSAVFPIPASPRTTSAPLRPARTASSSRSKTSESLWRPATSKRDAGRPCASCNRRSRFDPRQASRSHGHVSAASASDVRMAASVRP